MVTFGAVPSLQDKQFIVETTAINAEIDLRKLGFDQAEMAKIAEYFYQDILEHSEEEHTPEEVCSWFMGWITGLRRGAEFQLWNYQRKQSDL
jgi:hypothetical protein